MPQSNQQAQTELNKLKKSLAEWLKYRSLIQQVADGKIPGHPEGAKESLENYRPSEVALGKKLSSLLFDVDPEANLPDNPVDLARMVLKDEVAEPQAQGSLGVWIVAAATIVVLSVISNLAKKAADERQLEACERGVKEACPFPVGKWAFVGLLLIGGYFAWTKFGVGAWTKKQLTSGKHTNDTDDDED